MMSRATRCSRSVASVPPIWVCAVQSAVVLALTTLVAAAAPVHVLVKSHEQGQGMLLRRADTCYVLTAAHVVRGSDIATLIGSTRARRFGEARLVARFEPEELALVRGTRALPRTVWAGFY